MLLTVASPNDRRLLLDFVDLASSHRIQRHVDNQNDADGEVQVDCFDVPVVLQPAACDAHQWPPFVGEKFDKIDEEQDAGQKQRNSECIEAVEKEALPVTASPADPALECRPNVVAHHVQPKEAQQHADVDHVARKDARPSLGHESVAFEVHDRQADVQNEERENVAHQRLAVQVPQLRDEAVDAERNQQERQRENHS